MILKNRAALASLALSLALVSVGVKAHQSAEDPAVRLERAVQLETVDGDLEAAIEQYQQIIDDNGNHRAIVAKALLRLGGCYEKLGQKEARQTYQQLVDNYPDQMTEVKAALERLKGLASVAAAEKPSFRKIEIPGRPDNGVFSPDGKQLAFFADGVRETCSHGRRTENGSA